MKRIGVLSILLLFNLSVNGQSVDMSLFKDSVVPKNGRGDLYDLSLSPNRFIVFASRDSIHVRRFGNNTDTTVCQLVIKQGILEGHTLGSAGGYLLRFSNAENAKPDTIFDRAVQNVIGAHHTVYFSSSIWNPTQRYGHLYILDTVKSAYKAKLVAEFEYPIRQMCVVHDSLYLLTGGKLYRMQYGKPAFIADIPFTCNSMTGFGRYLYFGLSGAYARLDMRSKQLRYFVYIGQ